MLYDTMQARLPSTPGHARRSPSLNGKDVRSMQDIGTVFLDRDGVINRLRSDYVTSWEAFEFLPGAKEALRLLNAAGLRVIVVTNQRAVARGLLSETKLASIHAKMCAEVAAAGGKIDAIYYCPHDKDACDCRKPRVGMLLQAQRGFPEINFRRSVLVGDSLTDMQAGLRVGCQLILVTDTGYAERADNAGGQERAALAAGIPLDGAAQTLLEAARRIVTALVQTRVP